MADMMSEEEEEEECRICRGGVDVGALLHPCRCTGSIKYVHQQCLDQWLSRTNGATKRCELCHHPFRFSPVYADGAPSRLPTTEFAIGLIRMGSTVLFSALRTTLVLFLWVVFLPVGTSWMCRLFFMRSLHGVLSLADRLQGMSIMGDWMQGILLSVVVVGCFLALSALRDYMIQHDLEGLVHPPRGMRQPPPLDAILQPAPNQDADHGAAAAVHHEQAAGYVQGGAAMADEVVRGAEDMDAGGREELGVAGERDVHAERQPAAVFDDAAIRDGNDWLQGENANMDDERFARLLEMEGDGEIEVPLEEFVGLRGPWRQIFENAMTALIFNALFIAILTLVPFTLGRIVITVEYGDYVVLLTGYAAIAAILLSILMAGLLLSQRNIGSTPPHPLLRQVIGLLKYVGIMIKVGLLLGLELVIFPTACGWWLDMCCLELVDASLADRMSFVARRPGTAHFLHWMVGVVLMLHICVLVALLREIVRPEVLWFLRNPADPDEHPFRDLIEEPVPKHIRRVALSVLLYAPLTTAFVYCPVVLIRLVSLHNPYLEIPFEVLLIQISLPFAVEHYRPKDTFKTIIRAWFKMAGDVTGLTDKILPPPGVDVADLAPLVRGRPRAQQPAVNPRRWEAGDVVGEDVADEDDEARQASGARDRDKGGKKGVWGKVIFILAMAWVTVSVSGSFWLAMPLVLGRKLLSLLSLQSNHDVYAYTVGFYISGLISESLCSFCFYVAAHGTGPIVAALKDSLQGLKMASSFVMSLVVLPIISGLLIDLTFGVPLRVAVDQTLSLSPALLWVLGISSLKTGLRMVHGISWLSPRARRALLTIQPAYRQLDLSFVLQNFFIPLAVPQFLAVGVPYIISVAVLPALGVSDEACSSFYRFFFPLSAACFLSCIIVLRALCSLMQVHETIRDSLYLVGRKLHNIEAS